MKLIELYAEEFGLFTDRRFTLGEGLTLIEGANESGKSTLQALIRFLFYGFPRRGGEEGEERYKRISRKTRRAAGSVTFSIQGEEYLLCRDYILHTSSGREMPAERVTVTAKRDGSTVDLGGKTPGEYFLGLPIELYHSSVCVRQSEIEGVAAPATGDMIGELLFFGEGGARLDATEKKLEEARRELQHNRGRGGKITQLEEESEALQKALLEARDAAERLRVLRNNKARFSIQAQDKARELKETEAMLQAARLDAQLARYDMWHRAKEAEAEALSTLRACEGKEAAPLPPTEFVAGAREMLHRLAIARSNTALRADELALAQKEAARHPRSEAAAYVAENGGDTEIAQRAAKYVTKKRNATVFSAVFTALVVVLAVLGAVFLPALLPIGAVALAAAVTALVRRQRTAKRERAFYKRLGLREPAMLRTFLVQYTNEESARAKAMAVLENAEALSREAVAREAAIFAELQAAFAAVGAAAHCTTPAAAEAYLASLADREAAAKQAFLEERLRYENAKSAATALENGLDLAQETALRAARAALPSPTGSEAELERKQAFLLETARGIAEKLATAEREEITLMAVSTDPATLQARVHETETALGEARRRLAAIKMASEALHEADETLRSGVMPALAKTASAIFEKLTGGAYQALHVTDRFAVSVQTPEGIFPLSHFSAGCRDAAYFSLRMGLTELITKEPLPLLLDEVTARLDDTRAAQLLLLLSSICRAGGQCLLFTCHTREARLLGNDDFTHITLG